MKRTLSSLFLVLIFIFSFQQKVMACENCALNFDTTTSLESKIIVKLKQTNSTSELSKTHFVKSEKNIFPESSKNIFPNSQNYKLLTVEKGREQEMLLKFQANEDVEYAEIDGFYKPIIAPNDPYYSQQWYYPKFINLENFWMDKDFQTTNAVAIIDSGINMNLPDLKKSLWENPNEIPGNNIDDDGNGFVDDISGWNVALNNNDVSGDCYHGTMVSGIVGAKVNNKTGIAGLLGEKNKILLIKTNVPNTCVFNYSDIARALIYATTIPEIKVVSLSLGGNSDSALIKDVISQIVKNNKIVVVAGAGNDGVNLQNSPFYPASYKGVVAVSSYNEMGQYYKYNYGYKLDVLAPGKDVWTTYFGGEFGPVSGTSISTPFVSGTALLLSEKFPNYKASEIIQAIRSWAKCPSNLATCGKDGWDKYYGYGRVNPSASLNNSCGDGKIKSSALITSPLDRGSYVKNSIIEIRGTVKSNKFSSYILQWSNDQDFSVWSNQGITLENEGKVAVENGVLGKIDLAKLPSVGFYVLRLRIKGDASCLKNIVGEDRSGFFLN